MREVFEETGLSVSLFPGFRIENTYTFIHNGETIVKHVVYFLGEYANQLPIAQESEVSSIHLMDFDSAISVFQFENLKELLTKAHNFLMTQ